MTEFDNGEELEDAFVLANPNPVLSSDAEGILQFINPAATDLMQEVEVENADDLLPDDHKGMVKACLATGATLTEECQLSSRNLVWSYQPVGRNDVVHIYGYDVTRYHLQQPYCKSLPEANPNPVVTYNTDGKLIFKNSAVLKLLDNLGRENIEDILPVAHTSLMEYCFTTDSPVTEERLAGGRIIVWSYKLLDDCGDLCIYGFDVTAYDAGRQDRKALPDINPNPVLTANSDGAIQFTNDAVSQILLDFKIEKVEGMLPADHVGIVKACFLTSTPLNAQNTQCGKTFNWSYLPVDGSEVIYIYGHNITDIYLNRSRDE
jgi:transcriptional regulator of aromatic amino acid metabolism